MKIWVDADACPVPVKDIVIKAGHKLAISTIFVANKVIALPLSPHLSFVQVAKGFGIPGKSISKREELNASLKELLESKGSFLLEVMVGKENNVFPMVPQGRGVAEIVLSKEEI